MKRDVETILTMGIMEDVTIIPQPVGGNVNLLVQSVSESWYLHLLAHVFLLMIFCRF